MNCHRGAKRLPAFVRILQSVPERLRWVRLEFSPSIRRGGAAKTLSRCGREYDGTVPANP